jgi:hypothetical protein
VSAAGPPSIADSATPGTAFIGQFFSDRTTCDNVLYQLQGAGRGGVLDGASMSAIISLGSFERVTLTQAWPTEDRNFTPWLAEAANIKLLGEALDMEVEAVEHWVGKFRADILARTIDETDHRVTSALNCTNTMTPARSNSKSCMRTRKRSSKSSLNRWTGKSCLERRHGESPSFGMASIPRMRTSTPNSMLGCSPRWIAFGKSSQVASKRST